MKRWFLLLLPLLTGLPGLSSALETPTFQLASPEQARSVLVARDDFVGRLSPFDRAARLKTAADVSEPQYLAFVSNNVLPWEDGANRSRVTQALATVTSRLAELGIALPGNILVVRTTGREEGGAAYTRGHAIVLPDTVVADPKQDLIKVISHETFHIFSRSNEALRARAYKAIGFTTCPDFQFPADLADRKITNPDAPRNDHWIEIQYHGAPARAIPILFASTPRYDQQKGGEFFEYLQFRLALVSGSGIRLVDVSEVRGFFEQVGRNTDYIIHPEEILADNFALLFVKTASLPSPTIPQNVLRAIQADDHAQPATPADTRKLIGR